MNPTRIETEAKLVAPDAACLARLPEALRQLADHCRPLGTVALHDTYLDTEDWWFFRAGLACRIRRQRGPDEKAEQAWLALKELARAVHGVSTRAELEEALLAMPEPQVRRLPGNSLGRQLRSMIDARPIRVLFDVHNRRTLYEVRFGQLLAQVSADEVTFMGSQGGAGGGASSARAEVELERLEGPADALSTLADQLKKSLPLEAASADHSKFHTGLALSGLTAALVANQPPVAGQPPAGAAGGLKPTDRTIDVATSVLRLQLARMVWNEPGAAMGLNPEFLHQMRVATRRARAALRVFGGAIGRKGSRVSDSLRRRLAVVGDALGKVRDLDVYLSNLPDYAARVDGGGGGQPASQFRSGGGERDPGQGSETITRYRAHLSAQRDQARRKLAALLRSKGYAVLVRRIQALAQAGPGKTRRRVEARVPIASFARRAIRKGIKKVKQLGRPIGPDSPDQQFHALRLAVKRLRYTCEFVLPLFGRAARKFVRRLVELQDNLGQLQDAIVATRLLEQFAQTMKSDQPQTPAILIDLGQLIGWQRGCQVHQRAEFIRLWQRFDRKKVRRKLVSALDRAAAEVAWPR